MIEGVVTKPLKQVADERGWLTEILRSDWPEFQRFGQVYVTAGYPQVVKAQELVGDRTSWGGWARWLIRLCPLSCSA